MIVTVEKHLGNWAVSIVQGHQGFHLNSIVGTPKAEAEWMAKMFRKALKAHDIATITKFLNDPRRK